MAYTAEQIKAYGDQLMAGGGSYQDLVNAANQYGVPLDQLAGAYGMTGQQGHDFLSSQGVGDLSQSQIDQGRNWINTEWNGGYGSTGAFDSSLHPSFNGGTYDFSDNTRNQAVLGAGQAMGYDSGDMSQILGLNAKDIGNYWDQNKPQVDMQQGIFNADRNAYNTGNPSNIYATQGFQGSTPSTPAPMPGGQTAAPTAAAPAAAPASAPAPFNYGLDNGVFQSSVDPQHYTQNPYLTGIADDLTRRSQDALGQSLQMIRSHSVGTGGLGGSRQGVAEGQAISQSNDNLTGQLAGLYGQDFNNSMGRNLSQYQGDQNFYLGNQGQMQNFYTQQRGQDLSSIGLGAQLYGNGVNGEWSPINNANSTYQPWSGYGTSSSSSTGNNWGAGIGNGLATYQQGTKSGWW